MTRIVRMPPNEEAQKEYVLGTDPREIDRLFVQHRAWRPFVFDAWKRAAFRPGQVLLDIGCGPGSATLDLAELVGAQGRVIAVDQSKAFLESLERCAAQRELLNIQTACCDVMDWRADIRVEGVWCRWLFSFLSDRGRLALSIGNWCRPGARLVLHEYYDYGAWRMYPPLQELDEFVLLVMRSWRDAGGEPDIGLSLPRLMVNSGFKILEQRPLAQVVSVRDHAWTWLSGFVRSGLERLKELESVSATRAYDIARAFADAEATPGTQMVAPAVLEIIAENVG